MKKPSKKILAAAISSIFMSEVAGKSRKNLPNNFIHPTESEKAMCQAGGNKKESEELSIVSVKDGPKIISGFNWNIVDVKKQVSEFVEQGRLSDDLLNVLCKNGNCAPVEFELLDYKEEFDKTLYGKGKLIRRVVSFFNTYGGYLVFGVREVESETRFDVNGIDISTFDVESIKALIKEYTGERVQIAVMPLKAKRADGVEVDLLFLYIPKRAAGIPPLHFHKDGPKADRNEKPIFLKDSIYFRQSDECVEAKGPRILELNGERKNPHLQADIQPLSGLFRVNRIPHNLPDRNFICPKFIGRDNVVNSLWHWLSDDLSHVKVLAGEGGLGKSSLAYEFAERVSETPGVPFEQVVWLTAKERQFKAFNDQYVRVPERHFSSYEELLFSICQNLPFTSSEIEGATAIELKRMIKSGLYHTKSLIIVDDVDSLKVDEQRQVLELGMILGSSASRLLLTTRFNQSFSSDNVIKLSGLSLSDEFPLYLDALRERMPFPNLSSNEVEKIHQTGDGSPLFTESILRLLQWHSVNDAIQQWKGERGAAVRSAALKREIELLSPEAQRILLTVALLGEASTVELCEVLGYPSEMVEKGLDELLSLFLIAAPALASIPRFRVPENTHRFVVDPANTLVTDRSRLEREVQTFRNKNTRSSSRDHRVAAAISQAASLVRVNDIDAALATIQDARKKTQNHFDLLSYQATLHLKETPPKINEARALARKAFTTGCRKPEVFECWFEAEWNAKNYIGALEAADAALNKKAPGVRDWLIRKSASLASKASNQAKTGSLGTSIATMFEASETLSQVITQYRRDDTSDLESRQAEMHDQIWFWAGTEEVGLGRAIAQVDALQKMWQFSDLRITNIRRMLSAIEGMVNTVDRKVAYITSTQKNLCYQVMQRSEELLNSRCRRFPADSRHSAVQQTLENLHSRLDDAIARREPAYDTVG